MTDVVRRIVAEKRSIVVPLVAALALNLAGYAIVVRPRGVKSAGAADRAVLAAEALRAAGMEVASARALVEGKSRADEELNAFYQKVLPANLAAAQRLTYASLPALARRTNVRYEERHQNIEKDDDARLGRLTMRVGLTGDYESFRDFLFQLENAPEFVIIDNVTLVESDETEQTLTLELSTYFRLNPNGD